MSLLDALDAVVADVLIAASSGVGDDAEASEAALAAALDGAEAEAVVASAADESGAAGSVSSEFAATAEIAVVAGFS